MLGSFFIMLWSGAIGWHSIINESRYYVTLNSMGFQPKVLIFNLDFFMKIHDVVIIRIALARCFY